jgi:hypothetical protein
MNAPETVMSDYIKGFDAGYSYVLSEIERWQDEVGVDLHVLLSHLKMQDKPVEGKGATKYLQFGWLDRIIYWSNEGVVVNASPMMSVPNVAISDHMPVSTIPLSLPLCLC